MMDDFYNAIIRRNMLSIYASKHLKMNIKILSLPFCATYLGSTMHVLSSAVLRDLLYLNIDIKDF